MSGVNGNTLKKDDCSYVWNIADEERCEFVKTMDDCAVDSFLPYPTWLFCYFGTQNMLWFYLGLLALFCWLLYLFLILGTTSDNFFCPSLSVIAAVLRLSENIAGVTILAFGNGAPDIFTSLVSNEGERLIMFTELIGAGVFVTAIIAGSVAVFAPFRLVPRYFLRDALFYTLTAAWICYIIADHWIYLWEAVGCILLYVLFIIVVVVMQSLESNESDGGRAYLYNTNDKPRLHFVVAPRSIFLRLNKATSSIYQHHHSARCNYKVISLYQAWLTDLSSSLGIKFIISPSSRATTAVLGQRLMDRSTTTTSQLFFVKLKKTTQHRSYFEIIHSVTYIIV
uniref:Sodium/calcium exchanger membrane region domain-containing protein n=1 Tax=Trichogramma kaykai TaxID=54128 RepID=A0ABD2XKR0_9HYME